MERDYILLFAFLGVLVCHSAIVKRILADTLIFEDPPSSASDRVSLASSTGRESEVSGDASNQPKSTQGTSGKGLSAYDTSNKASGTQIQFGSGSSSKQDMEVFSSSGPSGNKPAFSQASGSQIQSGANRFSGQYLNTQSGGQNGGSQAVGSQINSGSDRYSAQALKVQTSGADDARSKAEGNQFSSGNNGLSGPFTGSQFEFNRGGLLEAQGDWGSGSQKNVHEDQWSWNGPGGKEFKTEAELNKDWTLDEHFKEGSFQRTPTSGASGSQVQLNANGVSGQSLTAQSSNGERGNAFASGSQFSAGSDKSSGQSLVAQSSGGEKGTGYASGNQFSTGSGTFSGQSLNAQSSNGERGTSHASGNQFSAGSDTISGQSLNVQSSGANNGGISQAVGTQFTSGSHGLSGQSLSAHSGAGGKNSGDGSHSEVDGSHTYFGMALSVIFSQWANTYGFGRRFVSVQKANETFKRTENYFITVGGRLGQDCFRRLLCESAANPSSFGEFSQICQSFFSNLDDYPPDFTNYVDAYAVGEKNGSTRYCKKTFLKCSLSSTDLQDSVKKENL